MLRAYFNYPNSRVSVHGNLSCTHVQWMAKSGQRYIFFETLTISDELGRFLRGEYQFAAQASINDVWLDLDFQDTNFELAVVRYVLRVLGERYKRFRDATLQQHCIEMPC